MSIKDCLYEQHKKCIYKKSKALLEYTKFTKHGVRILIEHNDTKFETFYLRMIINPRKLIDPESSYLGILQPEKSSVKALEKAFERLLKGVHLISLKESIDTSTPTGKLLFTLMSALSQFERDVIADRTREGLKAARARGKNGGRPKADTSKLKQALKLYEAKNHTIKEIIVGVKFQNLAPTICIFMPLLSNCGLLGTVINPFFSAI